MPNLQEPPVERLEKRAKIAVQFSFGFMKRDLNIELARYTRKENHMTQPWVLSTREALVSPFDKVPHKARVERYQFPSYPTS